MLVNRNPSIEAFSAQLLLTVHELLADIPGAAQTTGRWALLRLQTSLCYLGILDEPVILDASHEKAANLPSLWQNDPTVDPAWLAWVCAFYNQTPPTMREGGVKCATRSSWQADGSNSTTQRSENQQTGLKPWQQHM